jgi:ADP-ribosylglycohydrolase
MALRKPRKAGLDPGAALDRARGALLGLAVGDALGATNAYRRIPAAGFPQLNDGMVRDLQGGGPHSVKPGQVTDDTQMATCLASSLRELQKLDVEDVARRYVAWRAAAFDVGEQTAAVLDLIKDRQPADTAGRDYWIRAGKRPAGGGSLARTAPIGVFFAKDDAARAQASLADSAITHFDPRCQLACVALNGAIAKAIGSIKPPTPRDLVDGAQSAISVAGSLLGQVMRDHVRDVFDATAVVRADLDAAQQSDPQLYGPELHLNANQGFVRVPFRLAFWEALHAPSFEAALVDVANRGGDSCSNGAVTGALLGALHGEQQIPERWRKGVLEALNGAGAGVFWEIYHPRNLMLLVG